MPVDLEIHSSDLYRHDGEIADSDGEFLAALESTDWSNTHTITIVADRLVLRSPALSTLCRWIQRLATLKAVFVRLSPGHDLDVSVALMELNQACQQRGCTFCVDVLLDERVDGFEILGSNSISAGEILTLSRQLIKGKLRVRWLIPTIRSLIFRLEGIVCLAREATIEPLLIPYEIIDNLHPNLGDLSSDERLFVWDFITYRFLGAEQSLLMPGMRTYYTKFARNLEQENCELERGEISRLSREGPHRWAQKQVSIDGSDMRSLALLSVASVNERQRPLQRSFDAAKEVTKVLLDGARSHLLRSTVSSELVESKISTSKRTFKKVLLIGAYGGEHIGDAAILGGVLLRIHKRFATCNAVLMTQRLAHTRHLVPMLDVPVDLVADDYNRSKIREYVSEVDCIVFAGGPLIDLPKQLVLHLYTVSLARKMKKPFFVEGIGPGPFVRLPSRFTARRLMELASTISLRAGDAINHDVIRGLNIEVGRCPAFDYLESRNADLSRLPPADSVSIKRLMQGTEGRPVIGVNLRPIGHLYTAGATERDVAAYTRKIERRFERRFADGLRDYYDKSASKPCFIFFPMNAIQFGLSDLLSAYRIQKILGPEVDFRVWQADASLDGVVALLREVDFAITMRFHATIFALSQDCKVIGIDYRIGKRDKIAGLMDDIGQGEYCERIDLLTSDWLSKRLVKLVGS